jgi:hypothetical protein
MQLSQDWIRERRNSESINIEEMREKKKRKGNHRQNFFTAIIAQAKAVCSS